MYPQQTPSPSVTTRKSIATRQRVSRACDRCNHLRVKCDGQRPCDHCLVYGLDCKYDRERRKRGKGSLTNTSKENCVAPPGVFGRPNISNAPMTPVTTKTSPASSPCTFHLSIPPSHLFNGMIPDEKESLPGDLMPIPCGGPTPPQHIESQNQSFFKIEPGSARSSFSSVPTDESSREEQPTGAQSPCYHTPEPTCYATQPWNRTYETIDQPKVLSSPNIMSMPPENYQLLPFMPLCASCHTNPSVRLCPGSIVWLPSPPLPYYPSTECGAALGEESGAFCFIDQSSMGKET